MKSKQEALITKWAPVNILDIRRTETSLEHMAARGLIYHRQSSWNTLLGEFFCTVPHLFLAQFQKKEPQISRRYRLVPAPKNQRPSPEQLELYAHSGWQYVDFIDLFYASFLLFFSDDQGHWSPTPTPTPSAWPTAFLCAAWRSCSCCSWASMCSTRSWILWEAGLQARTVCPPS